MISSSRASVMGCWMIFELLRVLEDHPERGAVLLDVGREPDHQPDAGTVLVADRGVLAEVLGAVGLGGLDVRWIRPCSRATGPSSVPSSPGYGPVSTTSTKLGQAMGVTVRTAVGSVDGEVVSVRVGAAGGPGWPTPQPRSRPGRRRWTLNGATTCDLPCGPSVRRRSSVQGYGGPKSGLDRRSSPVTLCSTFSER